MARRPGRRRGPLRRAVECRRRARIAARRPRPERAGGGESRSPRGIRATSHP